MGRRARGSGGSRVRVFSIEDTDEGWSEPGPGPDRVPGSAHGKVPDGAAPVAGPADGPGSHEPSSRRGSWSRRARLLAAAGALLVVLLGAAGFVRGEVNETARLERVVAAGGVRPLGPDTGVQWRIAPQRVRGEDPAGSGWSLPTVVDGMLVVPGDPVVGYDPATGVERWRGPRASVSPDPDRETMTLCSGTGTRWAQEGPLVCTTSTIQVVSTSEGTFEQALPVRIDVMVAATGDVTASRAFDEGTQGATVFDDAIATVRWGADGQVVVDLADLATGEPRWSREIAVERQEVDYLGVQVSGSVLLVAVADRTVTLDATGEIVDGALDSWTRALGEGLAVVQHRDGTSTVLDRDGAEAFRTQGTVQAFGASDGTPARALFVTEGGAVMDASGATVSPRVKALDPETGRTLWSSEGTLDTPVAQVGDVGILSGAGRLWAVDLGSGQRLWEAPGYLAYSSAHTDGTDLYLVGSDGKGGTRITAISVDSGEELWTKGLLADTSAWGFGVRGMLVVVGEDGSLTGIG